MGAEAIELLVLDVDGVLTDGSVFIDDDGRETKRFNIRDGMGLRLWQRLGYTVAIVTARSGRALEHRMRELNVERIIQGSRDKGAAIDLLSQQTGIPESQVAFLGDDLPDLAALRRVGYPMAVADADPRVLSLASFITTRPGGHGAVREAVEHLLTARGRMDEAIALYD